ncbi:metallophosphoesterase family protein [Paenibacillus kandeliae]|uniref:metallophosphoesterase family protein n=1 Tax=Paenibacillus kandeliae TaxID=3231269 RepID=UPI003459607A
MNRQPFYQVRTLTEDQQAGLTSSDTWGERLGGFQVITDTHLTADSDHMYNRHWDLALADLATHAKDSLGIIHVGDVTDHGLSTEYQELHRIWEQYRDELPAIHFALGNHDVSDLSWQTELSSLVGKDDQELLTLRDDYLQQRPLKQDDSMSLANHVEADGQSDGEEEAGMDESMYRLWQYRLGMFNRSTFTEGVYTHRRIGGYNFLFLGTERPLSKDCYLSHMQLDWLAQRLDIITAASPGKPIFLFLHQPLLNTVAGSLEAQGWYGVEQDDACKEILRRYPQVLLFTGHTHWHLQAPHTVHVLEQGGPVLFNAASVAYLWTDDDTYREGSQGWYIDLYTDRLVLRGRDFANGVWIKDAVYVLEYGEAIVAEQPITSARTI